MSGGTASEGKIVRPGYHIRPKYDLHGLRRRRSDNNRGHVAGELPLTSMIDMFSILVIYLLMNFSATGEIFFLNKNLPLPKAGKTNPLATSPIISIVNENFILDTPPDFDGAGPIEDSSPGLDRITGHLKILKDVVQQKNIPSGNRVNLQAAEDTEIGLIKRAMTAAVSAGWINVNFVVKKAE